MHDGRANLRPPWKKGCPSPNGGGNPFVEAANVFRSDFWKSCTPERRTRMLDLMWARALGEYREPEFDDETGVQKEHPDGSPRFKPPQPPDPRAQEFICNFLGGAMSFKTVDSTVQVSVTDDRTRMRVVAERLAEAGLSDQLPPGLKALVGAVEPADP